MINVQDTSGLNGLISQLQTTAAQSASSPASSLLGNFSMSTIIIGLIAGLVGSAYFIYGKRQGDYPLLFSGMALWFVPLFITSTLWLSISCGALVCAPFIMSRYF